tara:strand:- start:2647 stop:2910 length:264 start_codon:yes stop_codon:yes gene_type:complete
MAKPKPDPIMSIERSRKQAKKRVNQLRKHNLDAGGENLSGPIDDLTAIDLETLLAYHRQTNVKASKIGVVRWAIRFAAETLRKEGKL